MIRPWRQALRLFGREYRSGELRLLILSLLIAVAATSAIGFFTDRLERAMLRQASHFLGADLVLRSARPVSPDLAGQARALGLQYSETLQFPSMLIRGDAMMLVSLKVADDHYPLRGLLISRRSQEAASEQGTEGPAPGEIWIAPRIAHALQALPGSQVTVGSTELRVTRLLDAEPAQGGGLFSLRPPALMHRADLAAADVVKPGSRVSYQYLFAGAAVPLDTLKSGLQRQLQPGQRLLDIRDENPTLGRTLNRGKQFLRLAGLLAVILAGIAIAMATRRYCERHYDAAALMRCLGARQSEIVQVFLYQLLLAGLLAGVGGILLGALAHFGLLALLAPLLPHELPPPGWTPLWTSLGTGFSILLGFSLPPLVRLRQVSPLRVLRRDLSPLPLRAWLVYGSSLLLVFLLLWLYSDDLRLTAMVLGGGLAAVLVLGGIAWGLLRLSIQVRGSLVWRLAVTPLQRHLRVTLSQLVAFGLTLSAMALLLLVRSDLIATWQAQLPERAPNHFLINIQPAEVGALESFLTEHQIIHAGISPMVRGRLATINGQPAEQLIGREAPGHRAIRRELNLTWSEALSPDNRIIEGRWWQASDAGRALISLEVDLARDLGVGVGDRLGFFFGSRTIEAEIASLRTLNWSSLRPNFFVIFAPGVLDGLPASYITSFHLPAERRALLQPLVERFPSFTLLEVDQLLRQIRRVIEQVTLAVEYVLGFVLLAGLMVLYAALGSSLDERLYEGALLRTLGASRPLLRRAQLLELSLLGGLSGLLAALTCELVTFGIYQQLFGLPYRPTPWLWLLTPAAGALLISGAGLYGLRPVLASSPLRVWRGL